MSTPVLLADPESREEWLAARRTGIGASEIAAVLGISPWESPFSLFWRKVHGWEMELSDEMRDGTRLEPVIAEWWTDTCVPIHHFVRDGALYASSERPWQLATPDRLIVTECPCDHPDDVDELGYVNDCRTCHGWGESPPVAVLECKYVAYTWDGWGEPGTDDIPVYYRSQVQQQCDVMGVDEWYLAALGPGGFREYRGRRDETDLVTMREAGRRFMARLAADDPPDIDGHRATLAAVKRLHPSVEDRDVEVDAQFADGYRRARAARNRADDLVARYEARARLLLGNARRLMVGKKLVVSRSVFDQPGDSAELMAIDDSWPTTDRLNPGRAKTYA